MSQSITVVQEILGINVCADNPVPQFTPFWFSATQDQTVFVLPAVALSAWVAINGISQSSAKTPTPDYVIAENVLTLSTGVDLGDTVFGMIQIA